jgi:hypothetical protein
MSGYGLLLIKKVILTYGIVKNPSLSGYGLLLIKKVILPYGIVKNPSLSGYGLLLILFLCKRKEY